MSDKELLTILAIGLAPFCGIAALIVVLLYSLRPKE